MLNFTDVKQALLGLDTSHICDALKSQVRVLSPEIRLVQEKSLFRLVGRTLTVLCEGDVLPVMRAIDMAKPEDVIMISACSDSAAVIGELLTFEAERRGVRGIIVDGFSRDTANVQQSQCLLFSKGYRPNVATKQKPGQHHLTIQCGGVNVSSNEIVFADADGIIVLSEDEMALALPIAKQIFEKEQTLLKRIQAGESLFDMTNFKEQYANIIDNKGGGFDFQK